MPLVEAHRKINVPHLERYHVLMYLLVKMGDFNHQAIEDLGKGIKSDIEADKHRSVGQIIRDSRGQQSLAKGDPFLNRVALGYDLEELSLEVNPDDPMLPREDGQPHSLVDSLVGGGPARPLLYDLYSMTGLVGLAETDVTAFDVTFYPTSRAEAHAKTLGLIFERLAPEMDRARYLAVVEKYDQKLVTVA